MEVITKNYEWIFSGIGVLILGYLVNYFIQKKIIKKVRVQFKLPIQIIW